MTSAEQLLARIEELPQHRHLLEEVDLDAFHQALHFRAHYLLNGHFWPELAMFYARPDKVAGSFFIRHHTFRVRLDDVEHYLSGLIAYRRFLIAANSIDRVHVIGDLYDDFWQALPASCRGSRPSSLDEMMERLRSDLAPGDCVLFKGSHGTGIHRLIGAFAPPSSQPGRGS